MDHHHHHNTTDEKLRKKKRRLYITAAITTVVLLLIILLIILSATVLRPKHPTTTVNSVTLQNVDVSLDAFHLSVHLNLTLNVNVSVKNPNKIGFKYSDSSAFLEYRGQVVGQAPLPAGEISGGQTVALPLNLTVMADRFLSDSKAVFNDVVSGVVPLTTRTKISGKVILVVFRAHVVSSTVCNLNVSISSKSILDNDCKFHTHLS